MFFRRLYDSAVLFLCGICLISSFVFAGGTTLYVFYPSVTRPMALQKQLTDNLPGTTVTVFGRYSDFAEKVRMDAPDAILTKPDVIQQLVSYSPVISGTRNGSPDEKYYLLSAAGRDTAPAPADARNVGVVDFLGRHGMDSLARHFFQSAPRLNRVSKVEDLLPLLTFGMADEVLVSERNADYLAGTSKIPFSRKEVPNGKIGIIAVGVKKDGTAAKTVDQIRKLPKETCLMLDIEAWK